MLTRKVDFVTIDFSIDDFLIGIFDAVSSKNQRHEQIVQRIAKKIFESVRRVSINELDIQLICRLAATAEDAKAEQSQS